MANGSSISISSCEERPDVSDGSPTTPAIMFSAGVLGNALALVLLEWRRRRRKQPASVFQVLVTALVLTDLLGTFSVSPLVLTAYVRNQSMIGMSELACAHFGFAMTFFSLVTLSILLLMALERCLSLGQPYFYERHVSRRCGFVGVAVAYGACALFCVAPFLGVGRYVQHCPGTWCFLDTDPLELRHRLYNGVYASWLLLMIVCTLVCNASVCYHLSLMRRRRRMRRRARDRSISISISEEAEHLLLLGFMTVAFLVCSLPLVIQVYFNIFSEHHGKTKDRGALLFLSANPIIDPCVVILSPPIPRLLWNKLCKTVKSKSSHEKGQRVRPLTEIAGS